MAKVLKPLGFYYIKLYNTLPYLKEFNIAQPVNKTYYIKTEDIAQVKFIFNMKKMAFYDYCTRNNFFPGCTKPPH